MNALQRVEDQSAIYRQAEAKLQRLILDALDDGYSYREIAGAALWEPGTLHRRVQSWRALEQDSVAKRNTPRGTR